MRTKAIFGLSLFLAAALLALGQTNPAKAKKSDPDMVKGPLLRMDLLERKGDALVPAKRDPFVPGASPGFPDDAPAPGEAFRPGRPGFTPIPDPSLATPPESAVNVRYLGFVQGKEKLLGLVLFNGQAVAVAAGESLGDVWKVVKITAVEIEIQGPAGAVLKFTLEGERK